MRYDFEKKENEGFPDPDNRWIWRLLVMVITFSFAIFVKLSCQNQDDGCPTTCAMLNAKWDGTSVREGIFSVRCGCSPVRVQRGTEFRLP